MSALIGTMIVYVMARLKNEIGNNVVTIASKVTGEDKKKIRAIADAFGMSFYELLQSLLTALLRYFDSGNVVTYNHNCMMNAFANTMYSMRESYNPLKIGGRENRTIRNAILFVEDSPQKRPQLLSVARNGDGQMIESLNFDGMVSEFLGCVDPDVLKRLRCKQKELGYFSITHTLHEIIMQQTNAEDEIRADIEEMFTDNRIPSGQAVNDDIHYKRKHRTNVDEYTTIMPNTTYRADL